MLSQDSFYKKTEGPLDWIKRFFIYYFLLQLVPLSIQLISAIRAWTSDLPVFANLFRMVRIQPGVTLGDSFWNWLLIAFLAVLATALHSAQWWNDPNKQRSFLYFVRTLARFRLAASLFAYGWIKFFPLLAPYPSISNLNTAYGDFTRWKLFSLSLGIVPGYESFLGAVELITAVLLLFRKTAGIGAFLVAIFLGNVFMSNLAYEGGDVVYSLYLISLALFVLSFDLSKLYRLLIKQAPTAPDPSPHVYLPQRCILTERLGRILLLLVFVVIYGFSSQQSSTSSGYQFPNEKGQSAFAGYYVVERFVQNDSLYDWNPSDSIRWRDVVFEKWPTISIRTNLAQQVYNSSGENFESAAINRLYELDGSGGRKYYHYQYDSTAGKLFMVNKNPAYPSDSLVLLVNNPVPGSLILTGKDAGGNSIEVHLKTKERKYLLEEAQKAGRRGRLTL